MNERIIKKVGEQLLIQADCLFELEGLQSNLFDVVVTSPPYNIGTKYNSFSDSQDPNKYLEWIFEWASQVNRLMKPDGSFFLNIGSKPTDPSTPFWIVTMLLEIFQLQNTFHWIKSITVGETSTGHYKPINSKRFVNDCHEYIFHFTKTGEVELNRLGLGVPYADPSNAKRWASGEGTRCRGNNWFIPYKTIQSKKTRNHPATFPIELVENCLKIHGLDKIKTVLDPFMGTGTTAVACEKLKLKSVGFEIDEFYFKQAVENVNKEYDK